MVNFPSISRFRKSGRNSEKPPATTDPSSSPSSNGAPPPRSPETLTPEQIKRATRTRLIWALTSSFFLLVSFVFLVLVEIGNTHIKPVLTSIYFIKIDLANVIPISVPNAVLINSVAQSLGLHDFYTAGLWNFCEGYNDPGVTHCSTPQRFYWFNPVAILQNELLAGATIAIPDDVNHVLNILKTASNWMFGLLLVGTILEFILIPVTVLSVYSRWAALSIGLLTFFAALFTTVGAAVATAVYVLMQHAFGQVTQFNIVATIGVKMFVLMWIGAGFVIFAWLIQSALCCCCASRRDVKTGRKRGNEKAYTSDAAPMTENSHTGSKRRIFKFGKHDDS